MDLKHTTKKDVTLKISRRGFAKGLTTALIAAPFAVRAQEGPFRARVKIDTERVIGDIDPKIYGNFIEHLGRCIDGGVFEEGSPLSDTNGFRRDVLEAAHGLNVTQLRWPGGNFSSNYHWMDGIGPRDKRPPRLEMAWGTVESNRFGTHEFLQYAEMIKTEPYVCVNLGTGTWTEAQDKQFAGPVEVAEVNGPDIKAENDFGATKVQTVTRSANADGRKLRYRLSPHSYTMLKAKLV
jgi:alpha-L-arabinofuranosidase